jgi:ribosomal protein L23
MAKTTKTTKEVSKEVKITSVLKNPRITEKAAKSQSYNAYLFDVSTSATKSEIMKAFVKQYKHKPLKVNTVTLKPKSHFRKGILSFGPKIKKAYVYLPKGKTIEVM